jgi:hypothetical protein
MLRAAGVAIHSPPGGDVSSPLSLTASEASEVPLTIEAHASQSGNLFEINSNGGSGGSIFNIDSNGAISIGLQSASSIGLKVNLAATPTGNAIEINSNGGSGGDLFHIDENGRVKADDGTISDVGLGFQGAVNTGFYRNTYLFVSIVGVSTAVFRLTGIQIDSGDQFGWGSSTTTSSLDTGLGRYGANQVKVTNGSSGGGGLVFEEMTSPSAPSTDDVVVFAEDNGSGKTRLMARFATGATQQLAIEP